MAGRFILFDGPPPGSITSLTGSFPTTSPTAGGPVDHVRGASVAWPAPPFDVDCGGSFSAGDDLETDGSGRAVAHSSGEIVARALEGSTGAGDTAWVVLT